MSCRATVAAPQDCAVTYIEALSEESLVADRRERNHHDHGEQAREGHDLRGLENGGNIWLGLVDLTINLYELFTYIKKVQGRTCQQQLESKCITCLFKQLDTVLPSTFEPGRVRVLSLLKVPCQNVRAGLEHISDQLSHQLVLGGLFQPHQELQQHNVASSVGKWVSAVGDQHGKPRIRLQIKRAGRSLTCQLCQSWHHENWCHVYGSSRGQGGKCGQVPGRWICQPSLSPPPSYGWNKKKTQHVESICLMQK